MEQTIFERCFAIVVGEEGGFGADPNDPGNWTGGAVGVGQCNGTKYGISAASYPTLNIETLTLAGAQQIYQKDYWSAAGCDQVEPGLAFLLFDAAVNNGVRQAVKFVQDAVGVTADGRFGPLTLQAVQQAIASDRIAVYRRAIARRINFMAQLPTWVTFGGGWSERLAGLAFHALALGGGQ
jgi:lysozyme family protein